MPLQVRWSKSECAEADSITATLVAQALVQGAGLKHLQATLRLNLCVGAKPNVALRRCFHVVATLTQHLCHEWALMLVCTVLG